MTADVLLGLVLTLTVQSVGTPSGALTAAELRSVQRMAPRVPIALSPDGNWVAYTVRAPDNVTPPEGQWPLMTATGVSPENLGSEVWIAEVNGRTRTRISVRGVTSWAPQWSPDGRNLAFLSDAGGRARLWVWDRAAGRARPVSAATVRMYFGFEVPRWTSDGRRLVLKLLPDGVPMMVPTESLGYGNEAVAPDSVAGAQVRVFTSPEPRAEVREGTANRTAYVADLAVIDLATGTDVRIARDVVTYGYWPSPDGRHVAFLNRRGFLPGSQQAQFSLEVAALGGTPQRRVLVDDVRQQYGISVSWSPDATRLAYTNFGQLADGKCHVVDLAGQRQSFGAESQALGSAYGAPLWDPAGRSLYLVAGRKLHRIALDTGVLEPFRPSAANLAILAIAPVAGSEHLAHPPGGSVVAAALDTSSSEQGFAVQAGGGLELLHKGPQSLGSRPQFTMAVTGSHLVFAAETASTPQQLHSLSLDSGSRRVIAGLNPDLDSRPWGTATYIEWRGPSGSNVRGAVLLPPGFARGQARAAVVKVYGGSRQSELAQVFDPELQMWLTRGYVVFLPDMPMGRGQPVRDIVDSVVAGVDRLVAEGYADAQRIGVWGWSYGGYSALALLTRTNRFRAGVVGAGFGNLLSQYAALSSGGSDSLGYVERGQGGLETHPWADRDDYIENSPFFFLDQVSAPILIVHGSRDTAVPVRMAHEIFVGLRRLGKRAELAVYMDEDHTIERRHNTEDYWNRMLKWFDEHLRAPAPPKLPPD